MLHGFAIHRDDLIPGAHPGHGCGAAILHKSDDRGVEFALGFSDDPHDAGHGKSKAEAEKRASCSNDDFIERFDRWKLFAAIFGFPLQSLHGRELGDGNESARWNRAKSIFHTADGFAPDRLSEPDGKLLNDQTAPARCQKVTQFVDHNEQVENQ